MIKIFDGKVTVIIPGMNYRPEPHFFARSVIRENGENHILFFEGHGVPRESRVVMKPCLQGGESCSNGIFYWNSVIELNHGKS